MPKKAKSRAAASPPKKAKSRAAAPPRRTRRTTRPRRPVPRKKLPRSAPPVRFESEEHIEGVRAALKRADYIRAVAASTKAHPRPLAADVQDAHPLIRMFFYGLAVDEDDARPALEPLALEDWAEGNLIALKRGRAVPLVRIEPYSGLLVATDLEWSSPRKAAPDAVMGLTGSSLWLANLTIRRQSRLTLDLGTGGGIQAMLASSHSERVIAVDANARALDFARFNAQLNGISNIEFVEGEWFEPVEGAKFDLIVSNPPFVISPDFQILCRDNRMDGDDLIRSLVGAMPGYLNDGGYGQIFGDWAQQRGEPWAVHLATWFAKTGCDAWVLRSKIKDTADYAKYYLEDLDGAEFTKANRKWLAYFARHRIERVGGGMITMRRSSGRSNWFRADEFPRRLRSGVGAAIERGFTYRDFLESRDDQLLLAEQVRASPHLRVEARLEPNATGWDLQRAQLTLTKGLSYSARIDSTLARAVLRCGQKRSLRELLNDVASTLGRSANDLAPGFLASVRQLIANGMLWPFSMYEPDHPVVYRPRSTPVPYA